MKTSKEIKKSLRIHSLPHPSGCIGCAYRGDNATKIPNDCAKRLFKDVREYIQQLEADNAQLNRCIENMTDKLNAANDEVAKLQAERDAAVEDMTIASVNACDVCKHNELIIDEAPCQSCMHIFKGRESKFEWRGVQKEE